MQTFHYEAMRTAFHIRLPEGLPLAADMARECFEEIDRLESILSRFRPDSDISRINTLAAGETIHVCEETHACLKLAVRMNQETGGLFDITIGTAIRHRKTRADGPPPALKGQLIIHPGEAAVTCVEPGRELDLGGIGKGFALDHLRSVLERWDAPAGLLSSGASTHLAFGNKRWTIELTGSKGSLDYTLQDASLSASGTGIQGSHIVHPNLSTPPAEGRVWVVARTGAESDAWSTALLLESVENLKPYLQASPSVLACFVEAEGTPVRCPGIG